jgi:predicted metal-binding membrane protein
MSARPLSSAAAPTRAPGAVAVTALIVVGAAAGWAWLAAMTGAMLADTDMAELGPGMGVFNLFNRLSGLPAEVRAGLAVLCTPGARHFGMPGGVDWRVDLRLTFVMWQAMVLAMMLPGALPVLAGEAARAGGRRAAPALLTLGYLAVWTGFSVVATLAQAGLAAVAILTPALAPASQALAGTVLVAVGLYQWTPLKYACLSRCRVPAPLLLSPTAPAATWFRAGLVAGRDCLGCCWALMAAMFAVGVMNLVWIALLGVLMVWEKRSTGLAAPRLIGAALLVGGAGLVAGSPAGAALIGRVLG